MADDPDQHRPARLGVGQKHHPRKDAVRRLLAATAEVVQVRPQLGGNHRPALGAQVHLHEAAILVRPDADPHERVRLQRKRDAEAVQRPPPAVRLRVEGQQVKFAFPTSTLLFLK